MSDEQVNSHDGTGFTGNRDLAPERGIGRTNGDAFAHKKLNPLRAEPFLGALGVLPRALCDAALRGFIFFLSLGDEYPYERRKRAQEDSKADEVTTYCG